MRCEKCAPSKKTKVRVAAERNGNMVAGPVYKRLTRPSQNVEVNRSRHRFTNTLRLWANPLCESLLSGGQGASRGAAIVAAGEHQIQLINTDFNTNYIERYHGKRIKS